MSVKHHGGQSIVRLSCDWISSSLSREDKEAFPFYLDEDSLQEAKFKASLFPVPFRLKPFHQEFPGISGIVSFWLPC